MGAVVGHLHIVVGTEEPTQHGVVQPPVHVDDVELAKHLVPHVAAVQPDGIERYRLPAPSIVGGIEDLGAVLPDGNRVAVKVVELARYAVFHDLFVFPGIDRCTTAPNTIFVDPVLVRRLHEYLHLFVFMIIHLAIIELSYTI